MKSGIAGLLIFCLAWSGCSSHGGEEQKLIPVTGVITLNKKPLPKASVAFHPTQTGNSSFGRTNENGEYTLMFNGNKSGAVPGPHRVEIRTKEEIIDSEGKLVSEQRELLPAKYNDQSTLTAEVSDGNKTINFELTAR